MIAANLSASSCSLWILAFSSILFASSFNFLFSSFCLSASFSLSSNSSYLCFSLCSSSSWSCLSCSSFLCISASSLWSLSCSYCSFTICNLFFSASALFCSCYSSNSDFLGDTSSLNSSTGLVYYNKDLDTSAYLHLVVLLIIWKVAEETL